MWHWIKRWRDWAMRELFWPLHRNGGPQVQGIHFSYEKAGLLVRNEPVAWNADAILVDVLIRFPSNVARRKTDFALRQPGQASLAAVTLHRHVEQDVFLLQFRMAPLRQTTPIELYWRSYLLGQAIIPLLTPDKFIDGVRVQHATTFVRLGNATVPCQAFVGSQGKGLLACGLITSPTSLAPLLDLDLAVTFKDHESGHVQTTPVRLVGSQLSSPHALVTIQAEKRPRRLGHWSVSWTLGDRVIARNEVRVISQRAFQRSLYLSDSRYVLQAKSGKSALTRHVPTAAEADRLGPCFLVASREPGMAALAQLEMRMQYRGGERSPVSMTHEVLVTDGPTLFLPGTVAAEDVTNVAAFEILARGQSLGILSTSPAPAAAFTSEGGFKSPDDYGWSLAAEEELADRLGKLMEIPMD